MPCALADVALDLTTKGKLAHIHNEMFPKSCNHVRSENAPQQMKVGRKLEDLGLEKVLCFSAKLPASLHVGLLVRRRNSRRRRKCLSPATCTVLA